MNDTEDTVPREKYHEVLDQRNQLKNYWHNVSEKKEWLEENTVPKSDLEELVERWRDSHEWATENREICSNEAIRKAESMIEDLEAVLEE